eukprot:gnl/TRDRNA2_/TRDRNA2_176425_c11_seq1.p1 gnl/TRDRNA2_/TRDRNA2_176425_c11~~gnl/TRDRNA2_/TRDRNA2_176425_c11_seq1.p1  ORF type:complete len:210 (-),score=22.76 gnl/TRDRNA2_/TRDRNA2_176425_c11_seq1:347-976(-)
MHSNATVGETYHMGLTDFEQEVSISYGCSAISSVVLVDFWTLHLKDPSKPADEENLNIPDECNGVPSGGRYVPLDICFMGDPAIDRRNTPTATIENPEPNTAYAVFTKYWAENGGVSRGFFRDGNCSDELLELRWSQLWANATCYSFPGWFTVDTSFPAFFALQLITFEEEGAKGNGADDASYSDVSTAASYPSTAGIFFICMCLLSRM